MSTSVKTLSLISITALSAFISGCAPAPVLKAEASIKKQTVLNLPEIGIVHAKKAGQTLISHSVSEKTVQRAAIMTNGFQREQSFKSSGYSIDIAEGAKGLLIDDYSACFNNKGANGGVYKSTGKANFCFYDKDHDRLFETAMLDSFNSWGSFPITPTSYVVKELNVGTGDVIFKRELTYVGNRKFEYKEYQQEAGADPVVQQSVAPVKVGHKELLKVGGAVIEIRSISDSRMKYSILKHFES